MKAIKRDYRYMRSPAKFLSFCIRVKHGLIATQNLPGSVVPFREQYIEKVDSLEAIHHVALDGSHTMIRERDKLSEEIVVLLDQIASLLEAAYILNPNALLTTGFTITQERKTSTKKKSPLAAPQDFNVFNVGEKGRALASANTLPGALLHEIHINRKDPSVEDDWFHKAIFSDSRNMVMESLASGNTFFRMRHYGQDGPGPWSVIVTTTIT